MIRATRTMRARRNGRCPLCQTAVLRGQQIALLGRTWVHTACALAWQRARGPPGHPHPPDLP